MTQGKDPYEVLGLHPGASLAEVEEAYRGLLNVYDPSKQQNPNLRATMQTKQDEVEAAYRSLIGGESGDFRKAPETHRGEESSQQRYRQNTQNQYRGSNPYATPFGRSSSYDDPNFQYSQRRDSCCGVDPGCCASVLCADMCCNCCGGGC